MRNVKKYDQWHEIKEKISQLKQSANSPLNSKSFEQFQLINILKESCKIDLDMNREPNLSCMEILSVATRFIHEKYKFRSYLLGISVNSIKTYENRARIKLGLDSVEFLKYWFLEKKIVRVFPHREK